MAIIHASRNIKKKDLFIFLRMVTMKFSGLITKLISEQIFGSGAGRVDSRVLAISELSGMIILSFTEVRSGNDFQS